MRLEKGTRAVIRYGSSNKKTNVMVVVVVLVVRFYSFVSAFGRAFLGIWREKLPQQSADYGLKKRHNQTC